MVKQRGVYALGNGTIQGYKYNVSSGEFELKGTRELVGHTQCFEYQGHCAIVYPESVSVVSIIESGSDCAPGALNFGATAVGVGKKYKTYNLESGHWGYATGCVCLKGTGKVEAYCLYIDGSYTMCGECNLKGNKECFDYTKHTFELHMYGDVSVVSERDTGGGCGFGCLHMYLH